MTGNSSAFVLHGDICYSADQNTLVTLPDGYLLVQDGLCLGAFAALPEAYGHWPLRDYSGQLIIPGLIDLHTHAPQYAFRGVGMDLELLDWLQARVFPEEAKYCHADYAKEAYGIFVEQLRRGATSRACIFATAHTEASLILMELLEEAGLSCFVGRVNMDRNCPDNLREQDAKSAARNTAAWIEQALTRFTTVRPILTPRFIPSCTDELMEKLAKLQETHKLPLQSHLSENEGEIAWVKELCPASASYGAAYDAFGLFGSLGPTVMAHCVHSGEDERRLMKERGVTIAHCPQSNTNLSSGIAPLRAFLNEGQRVGLGTDVAGGATPSMLRAMGEAIGVSKLRWRLLDQTLTPLTVPEAFWLGTLGGGSFFGKVGTFLPGYEFDAVVIADAGQKTPLQLSLAERLERLLYLGEERDVLCKFVQGKQVFAVDEEKKTAFS